MSAPSRVMLVIVLCSVLLLGSAPLKPTRAELLDDLTFNVNSYEDLNDVAINSVCAVDEPAGDVCTLRAAIAEIRENLPNHENIFINLPAGTYTLTIPPDSTNDVRSGDLNITTIDTTSYTVTIAGIDPEPAVIDANQLDRVFDIGPGVRVVMENVVIRGGLLLLTDINRFGAGINNEGELELYGVVIENNEVRCGQETCSTLLGGGLMNYGNVSIQDSTIRDNISDHGSAFYTMEGTNFLSNSTIANNLSKIGYVIMNRATLNIRNSTLSGNATVTNDFGSGIYNNKLGILLVESSTFANKGYNPSIRNEEGIVTIQDTIFVAEPGYYNCAGYLIGPSYWVSLGYNIFNDASCPATGTGDLLNTDPLLGLLSDWGGPTQTISLEVGSPAVNHRPDVCMVDGGLIIDFIPLAEDQRHVLRNDGDCDTGAFEGAVVLLKTYLPLALR